MGQSGRVRVTNQFSSSSEMYKIALTVIAASALVVAQETTDVPPEVTTMAASAEPATDPTGVEGASTLFPPLVPCPEPCPAESGYFEVEPCGPFYCSCVQGIGYLQECQDPLVFHTNDEELGDGECDWPYNDPDCAEYPEYP